MPKVNKHQESVGWDTPQGGPPDEDGGIYIAVQTHQGKVVLDLGPEVGRVDMNPSQAMGLSDKLRDVARQAIRRMG